MKKNFIVMLLLTALMLVACKTKEKEVEIEVIPESPLEMMQTSSNNFKKYWDAGAVDELTNEFTDDAIRVIGISQSPHIGKQEIKLSFQNELGEGNDLEGSHIEVTTAVVRKVSPNVLIGAGTWNILNSNNISLDNGKWGNIYEIKDGEIKFLMESAYSSKVVVKDSSSKPEIIKLNKYVGAGEENLKGMKKGDLCFFYHSNIGKEIVGIVEVIKEAFLDKTDKDGRFVAVQVKFKEKLKKSVTLEEVKKTKSLSHLSLIKQSRLSVMPIDSKSWKILNKMSII